MPWNKPFTPPRNQRLDPELYQEAQRITFITIRAYRHATPFVRDDLNQMIVDTLGGEMERLDCCVYTYCLMPDHLHYLISPKQDGISVLTFTKHFKGKSTNQSWKLGWQGKLWQPRFYDHIVRQDEGLQRIIAYILHNPVRKGLVDRPEDWKWSGNFSELP